MPPSPGGAISPPSPCEASPSPPSLSSDGRLASCSPPPWQQELTLKKDNLVVETRTRRLALLVRQCRTWSVPALVFSDQFLGFGVFGLQTLCFTLGFAQSLADNNTQFLGLLPVPGSKSTHQSTIDRVPDNAGPHFSDIYHQICYRYYFKMHRVSILLLQLVHSFRSILHSLLQLILLALPASLLLFPFPQLGTHTMDSESTLFFH